MTAKEIAEMQLKSAIERLNKLYLTLQCEYRAITDMQKGCAGTMKFGHLQSKKSGLRIAKKAIEAELKELEFNLKTLEL